MSGFQDILKQTDFRWCAACNRLHAQVIACPACAETLTLVDHTFFLGKTIGKYTVKQVLGAGGMGVIFKAVHRALDKTAAIKIFIPKGGDKTYERRFLREARILGSLKHPHVVEVYDFDICEWGTPFYVMEYLHGNDLSEEMRKYPNGMPVELFNTYFEPVIAALAFAHKKKIVHRDLKPANIFIDTSHDKPLVKLLDFGIAKSMATLDETAQLTATGMVMGTPWYLSPEQVTKQNIGPHTDQYSLALLVAEMLTGKVFRAGKTVEDILFKEVHKPIRTNDPRLKKLTPMLRNTLATATMVKPTQRFRGIEAFGHAVRAGLKGIKAPDTQPEETLSLGHTVAKHVTQSNFVSIEDEVLLEARKKRRLIFAAAAALLAAILTAVWYFLLR